MKCFLFDLDGVLVNACEWHYVALNRALMEVCGFDISRKLHETKFNGLPTKSKLMLLNVPVEKRKEIWNLKQEYTIQTIRNQAIVDNEKILLHEAIKTAGHKIACVTNSIRMTADLMLKLTGQYGYMDLIITNEDVVNPKPSPEGYLKAMSYFGFENKKKEVYIFEDSEKGRLAAKASSANLVEISNATEVTLVNLGRFL